MNALGIDVFVPGNWEYAYGQKGGWGPRPSGMTLRVKLGAPKGERVLWMNVGGKPVTDDAVYAIATCDRHGDAEDTLCRFGGAFETKVTSLTIQQAMRSYFEKHTPIRPVIEARVSAQDARGRVWSQYELGRETTEEK